MRKLAKIPFGIKLFWMNFKFFNIYEAFKPQHSI